MVVHGLPMNYTIYELQLINTTKHLLSKNAKCSNKLESNKYNIEFVMFKQKMSINKHADKQNS